MRKTDSSSTVTIYHKWPRNAFNNKKARNQILQPHSLTSSLITSNILCLHGRSSWKCLVKTFRRNSSSCHQKNQDRSRLLVIKATTKIRIRIANNLKLIRLLIGNHVIFGSMQISE